MRNLMKLIAITAMTALLLFALITCASADEKIYTSPVFKLPPERLEKAEELIEAQEKAEAEPEESDDIEDKVDEGEESADLNDVEDEFDEDEGLADLDDAGSLNEEPAEVKRQVIIESSQGEIVTEGDRITLTSHLVGFGDAKVAYQWQVDRGDGNGWVNVDGANGYQYQFIANRETIQYSWQLIVTIIGE